MVARQSKMAISKITTQKTELKYTHINLAVLIRHSFKYKNTVSQKTSYRDTETQIQALAEYMKISLVFKGFKGMKGSQVERRRGRRREVGHKGWPYRCLPTPADSQALQDFILGL